MQVFVKTLTGRTVTLDLPREAGVEAAKQALAEKDGVPAELQRLVFGGKQLEDGRALADYGVQAVRTSPFYTLAAGPGGPAGERERRGRRWPAAGGRPAGSPSGLARPGWALRPSSPPRSLAAPCARHARALVPTPGAQLTAPLRHRCPARSPCARPQESTLHLVLSLDGGAKKRKKKVYTTPKVSQPTRTVLCWPNKTGPANPTCLSLVRPTRC